MLGLSIKGQNVHGMRDPRWTIFQKVHGYKELISLQKRDREVVKYQREKLNRQEERLLGDLRKIAKQKQDDLRNALLGNQNKMWSTLGVHRRIQLAQGRNTPERVIENLYQMIDYKRKMKDKQLYTKRMLMGKYEKLAIKKGELDDLLLMQRRGIKTQLEKRMQTACQGKHNATMRTIAATIVRQTYSHILKILHKDATYYNSVLHCLETDCTVQSEMLILVTEMGQVVTEYVDDLSEERCILETIIRINMLERENSLKSLRDTIGNMRVNFKQLVRSDSVIFLGKDNELKRILEIGDNLFDELRELENILTSIKQITLVSEYEKIFSKLFNQQREHDRLQKILKQFYILRDSLTTGILHLKVVFNLVSHTYNEYKIRYLEEKRNICRAIRHKQKRIDEIGKVMVGRSHCSEVLRQSFGHIWNILRNVHIDGEVEEETEIVLDEHNQFVTQYASLREIKVRAEPSRVPLSLVPEGEDSLSLMEIAKSKLRVLHNAFKPDSKLMRYAELFFNRAMVESKDEKEREEEIDLLEGLIIEDNRLPSYASVKAASRQFVLENSVDELALVAAQVAARKKPGAYFRRLMKAEEKRRKANKYCGVY